ncbi:unnamed protein product [Paramecium sonneborni]|uniref:Uncharacterized protein n=1 Tax=Paramecium sonneborni TaxID=65129 RepID=A0A8S1KNE4_9CILI|nr:unnamed protein product [Paramecium sonneborni]
MFNQMFCGIITKKGDICKDNSGNLYQEIQFREVHQNESTDGRILSVRLFDCLDANIYDMIICYNFRMFISKKDYKYPRLEKNRILSQEYVGNEDCQFIVNESMFEKMKKVQQNKKKGKLDYYFKKI